MKAKPTPTWLQLEARLKDLSNDDLLALLRDLYAHSPDNQRYLNARFLAATPNEQLAPYRRLIKRVFDPNDAVSLDLDVAHAALAEFAQTSIEPSGQIDSRGRLTSVVVGHPCPTNLGHSDSFE